MHLADVPPWPVYSAATQQTIAGLVHDGAVFDYSGESPAIRHVEQGFSELHGGAHAVTFNSGTSALFAAFVAVGVQPGDEVIVPNLTFLSSMTPLLWLGATPVLVDSDTGDPSIGARAIEAAVTSRTRAVVVTHLFGNPVDAVAIVELCRRLDLRMIEDCSHAHASVVGDKHVGSFGDAAVYSLGAGKLVSGGHGGVLVTPDPRVRDLALLSGHFKPRTRTDILTSDLRRFAEIAFGGNLRLSPLAAALAMDHLHSLDELSRNRCANVAVLDAGLEDLLTPVRTTGERRNLTHFDMVYSLPADVPAARRADLLTRLVRAGTPITAPSTRPLNRVLHAVADGRADALRHLLADRLLELAQTAPEDAEVSRSIEQHDRMLSFPARRLYLPDLSYAERLVEAVRPVVKQFLDEVVGG